MDCLANFCLQLLCWKTGKFSPGSGNSRDFSVIKFTKRAILCAITFWTLSSRIQGLLKEVENLKRTNRSRMNFPKNNEIPDQNFVMTSLPNVCLRYFVISLNAGISKMCLLVREISKKRVTTNGLKYLVCNQIWQNIMLS